MNPLFGSGGNSLKFYEDGNKNTFQAPKWLANLGLDAYEYQAGKGITASQATLKKIGNEGKLYNIKMSLHTPYFISLSSIDLGKRLKSIDYIKNSLYAAEALQADTIVIHTGSASKISRDTAINLTKDTIYKTLEQIGYTKIKLGLETMGKLNQLGTLNEVIEICKLSSQLYPVVDFGHLNARNLGGLFNTCNDYKNIFDKIACSLGDEKAIYLHCHFSKIEYTKAGEKKHLTFEDSNFGPEFEPLIETIIKENLSPCIICESHGTMSEDALTMKNYYNKYKLI